MAKHASRPPRIRLHERGAALLAAMLTVALVATFAASAMWQQWRAIEVESAERARIQSAWILVGALDWSRLILREDSLARGDGTDNLTEPWSIPLEEARLSSFLSAQNNVSQIEDASAQTDNAFLSGRVTDLQSRMNLANLVSSKTINEAALNQFTQLFNYLGLPPSELTLITNHMLEASTPTSDGAQRAPIPLMPQTVSQLSWWGCRRTPSPRSRRMSPSCPRSPSSTSIRRRPK
ncbi:type II secretion system minor pseudopilin GspK [Diaphorobacter aerolatus]|uniref:type II secretion system minor pseudopilin GspK n=1 Tax=Diaphorobacter aerolatus TaxID=1288495 RepID=UPI00299F606E|nr:type II secretion system minor pseudopilin GspK [Diaphorobacter aerolatus]